ncbi:UNVERIFIED_CONTAM: hypothetical protein FKN15_054118 [Acipenser sinensis]
MYNTTKYQLYIPKSLRSDVLHAYHSNPMSGHMGRYKTLHRILQTAYWPGIWKDVVTYVRNCQVCQSVKPENTRPVGKLQSITVTRPWEMVGVDLMGPLPNSSNNNTQLLVVVDYYTRWVELFPLRQAKAVTIANCLRKDIFTRWGTPAYLLSDRGPQFVSEVLTALCKQWNVVKKQTTAYHPQTNFSERINRILKSMMASYVQERHAKWDCYLAEFRYAINSSKQETTGYSPAELNLGRSLKGPIDQALSGAGISPDMPAYDTLQLVHDLKEHVQSNVAKAKARQKRNYDKHRRTVSYKSQDRVWVRNHVLSDASKKFTSKLAPRWKGPYRIVEKRGPVSYLVCLEDTGQDVRTIHVCDVKPFYPTAEEHDFQLRKKVLEIFKDDDVDEESEFAGFTKEDLNTMTCAFLKGGECGKHDISILYV